VPGVVDAEERFAANVARLRRERGLTQEQLGQRCGLGLSYISKIEAGDRSPGVRITAKLAKGLGVEVGALFEGVES
jgi:transcriptional regulator with XRE-family HTH domain